LPREIATQIATSKLPLEIATQIAASKLPPKIATLELPHQNCHLKIAASK
jgi:hypothetical protein